MELWISVNTCGEKCSFSFSAGFEIDYVRLAKINTEELDDSEIIRLNNTVYKDIADPQKLDWDYIRSADDGTLGEAFWEAMNENPEWEIISLLEETPEYPKLKDMSEDELEEFVYAFVAKTLVTSEMTFELDGIDVTDMVEPQKGEWDDEIFSEITNSVMYQFRKMFS